MESLPTNNTVLTTVPRHLLSNNVYQFTVTCDLMLKDSNLNFSFTDVLKQVFETEIT